MRRDLRAGRTLEFFGDTARGARGRIEMFTQRAAALLPLREPQLMRAECYKGGADPGKKFARSPIASRTCSAIQR
jgi:hypothetical protein